MAGRMADVNTAVDTREASTRASEDGAAGDESRVVAVEHLSLAFDDKVILKDVSFAVPRGHTKIILGASGAGKSLTLKILLGLLKPDKGAVWIEGARVDGLTEVELMSVRENVGMVFQEGALFDSLTVRENVGYRLYEETDMPLDDVDRRVREVLGFVSLDEFIDRMPSALSGGQRRRVAIARAMASNPRILLYDEATTGLDPITATTVDDEVIKLRDLQEVTSILVTHQLRDAFYVATNTAVRDPDGSIRIVAASPEKERETKFLMLRDGVIAFEGDADALRKSEDPYIREFLS
jgi:phospholipid/cholesterol/gamma-HCH transport system ATP-binding protein